MHDKEHQNAGVIDENEEADALLEKGEGIEGEKAGEEEHKVKKTRKGKMHKKYSTNFLALIIKFLLVLTVLEGYFVLNYI